MPEILTDDQHEEDENDSWTCSSEQPHGQLLQHNMQQIFLTRSTHTTCCPIRLKPHSKGPRPTSPLITSAGCWRGNQPERQNESQLLTVPLSLSLCYWTVWTSFPSGGQREDQHKVHWAMRLHPNTGTLMERFAAQNTPCSLYWDLTFERLPVSDDLAGQLTDLLCSWVWLPLLVSQNFSVQCRVYEWMSGCIRP